MPEKARIGWSGVLAVGFGAIVVGLCVAAAFSLKDKMSGGLGGSVFPTPVVQKRLDEAPKETVSTEKIRIDRQKSIVIVRVPVPAKEEPPPEESARAAWGQLGDYFGGTLNPVFGFASLVLLLITLGLQARELSLTRLDLEQATKAQQESAEALRKQSFEQTFFAWLGTYREILAGIRVQSAQGQMFEARGALQQMHRSCLSDDDIRLRVRASGMRALRSDQKKETVSVKQLRATAMLLWENLYGAYESDLGSLFRVLYRLIKWIDEQDMSNDDKWLYVGIVRSQLSWIEMLFLFYNGMTTRGAKFKVLIERYALFDNLTAEQGAVLYVFRDADLEALGGENPNNDDGYKPDAYGSDQARQRMREGATKV